MVKLGFCSYRNAFRYKVLGKSFSINASSADMETQGSFTTNYLVMQVTRETTIARGSILRVRERC